MIAFFAGCDVFIWPCITVTRPWGSFFGKDSCLHPAVRINGKDIWWSWPGFGFASANGQIVSIRHFLEICLLCLNWKKSNQFLMVNGGKLQEHSTQNPVAVSGFSIFVVGWELLKPMALLQASIMDPKQQVAACSLWNQDGKWHWIKRRISGVSDDKFPDASGWVGILATLKFKEIN